MKPEISVIVPVYNGEKTIDKCIKSILKSSFKNFEIITINDNSTDNSLKIIKKFPIKIFNVNFDSASKVRNFGAKKAKAKILVFVDQDVVIKNDTLKKFYEILKRNPDVSAAIATPDKNRKYKTFLGEYENLYLNYSFTRHGKETSNLHSSTFAIRKSVFQKVGGFNEKIKGVEQEDRELGERLVRNRFRVWFLKNVKVVHLKEYNLKSFIRTRINRGRGYIKNVFKYKIFNDHIPLGLKLGIPLLYLALFLAPFNYFLSISLIAFFALINFDFFKFLYKERDITFAIKALFILIFDMIITGIGVLRGVIDYVEQHRY
jgi:cellulose synthase/poly-beta-1,6-N-acetylglucosamine synthase-like glycosyltransferase